MQREYRKWKSPSLGKEMEMLIFGKEGTPVLIFPTADGRYFQWEEQGVMEHVSMQIDEGYNQFFCVDTIAPESLLNEDADPYNRLMRETQYQSYIMEEVVPMLIEENSNPYLITTGAELGAWQALNFALKYPDTFKKIISISGYFDINIHLDGYKDDNSYFNNPVEFMLNMNKESLLKSISSIDIRLLSYMNDPNRNATEKMSEILWMKFIDHEHYVWDEETHDLWNMLPDMFKEHLF